ncbi:winged helix-turn-helix domain-containing protein (plasmid) [Paraburkholderia sp. D15]|uniref:winged helix-turn-helix domain-containing protein n=1 Tax=Paraburkholderia sp. D15 TaxID=2880218 RepID=UPI00247A1725|nr:winged helix-turn-helix domain-containing protein [Paraburkholderia sp. D15]WGS54926.1 winged helix-turn-helix domain-containing protein [Paraburkholderia sp. D15]
MSGRIVLFEKHLESAEVLWTNAVRYGFHPELAVSLDAVVTMLAYDPLPAALIMASSKTALGHKSFLKALRSSVRTRHLPVIVIAPAADEDHCIDTLAAGADDYVTTPFSPIELYARVKAILRPRLVSPPETIVVFDGLTLDPNTRTLFVMDAGERVDLYMCPTGFKLFRLLIKHAGQVLSRETILKSVWGEDGTVSPRLVDVHVYKIREVLREARRSCLIETVPKVGYRIDIPKVSA